MNIAIGTLLRGTEDNSPIYIITDETKHYFIATLVGSPEHIYWRMYKDMNHDDLEVIG